MVLQVHRSFKKKWVEEGHGLIKAQLKDPTPERGSTSPPTLKIKSVAEGHWYNIAQPEDIFMVNRKLQNKLDVKKHIDKITICNRALI